MNKMAASPQLLALIFSTLFTVGCSATPGATQLRNPIEQSATGSIPSMLDTKGAPSLTAPALVAVHAVTFALEYWPMRQGGDNHPVRISKKGLFNGNGMVANGRVVSLANAVPAEVLQFNVDTKALTTLPDPYGIPVDIAIGKDSSLYVLNFVLVGVQSNKTNVAWYPGGAPNPKELTCSVLNSASYIAVDNEGNLYVLGYIGHDTNGIIKIPNGPNGPDPTRCKTLDLGLGTAYTGGVVVDPKTDDLVTLTNPDMCAGGVEGLMTIFPKPYRRETGQSHVIGRNCSTGLRLSADSKIVFVNDFSLNGKSFVLQRSFPDGLPEGSYRNGDPISFTTIPNTLPN
jgi:hypothetical protein